MGLKFHDGTHKLYKTYTDGKAWSDAGLLRNPPAWMLTWNTEALIKGVLTNNKSKLKYKETATVLGTSKKLEKREVELNLLDVVSSGDANLNIWVLKGLHQHNDPHLTIGHDGFLWHLNVQTNLLAGGRVEAYVTRMSRGDWGTQEDADGFTKV